MEFMLGCFIKKEKVIFQKNSVSLNKNEFLKNTFLLIQTYSRSLRDKICNLTKQLFVRLKNSLNFCTPKKIKR